MTHLILRINRGSFTGVFSRKLFLNIFLKLNATVSKFWHISFLGSIVSHLRTPFMTIALIFLNFSCIIPHARTKNRIQHDLFTICKRMIFWAVEYAYETHHTGKQCYEIRITFSNRFFFCFFVNPEPRYSLQHFKNPCSVICIAFSKRKNWVFSFSEIELK